MISDEKFIGRLKRAHNATQFRVRQNNNGTEILSINTRDGLIAVGISHETSVPRSPQQNGVVESEPNSYGSCRTIHLCESSTVPMLKLYHCVFIQLNRILFAKADIGIFVGYAPSKKATESTSKERARYGNRSVAFDELNRRGDVFQTRFRPRTSTKYFGDKIVTERRTYCLQSGRSRSALVKDPEPPILHPASSSNTVNIDVTPNNQLPHVQKWTQAHSLDNIIGDKDRPVSTRKQLETDAIKSEHGHLPDGLKNPPYRQRRTEKLSMLVNPKDLESRASTACQKDVLLLILLLQDDTPTLLQVSRRLRVSFLSWVSKGVFENTHILLRTVSTSENDSSYKYLYEFDESHEALHIFRDIFQKSSEHSDLNFHCAVFVLYGNRLTMFLKQRVDYSRANGYCKYEHVGPKFSEWQIEEKITSNSRKSEIKMKLSNLVIQVSKIEFLQKHKWLPQIELSCELIVLDFIELCLKDLSINHRPSIKGYVLFKLILVVSEVQ
ncbi:retrovirus-related pol polyprotein from transposon TNT 1-94 [Tanacetum coccineum]|uniref:Retrovirus-related pol polyprotein from transposon TNT 1-94 n=1 Tax=Tanacetum coccineum TaxID=301880 RepID=A0ABQ5HLK5_9ASTR